MNLTQYAMKITRFFLLAMVISLACACEKDVVADVTPDQPQESSISNEMLSFASLEEMQEQIKVLSDMEPNELKGWYASRNFESQYDAMYRFAEKIDNASSLEEAEALKRENACYFLFNENPADEELFNPYLRNENPDYAYVCNINGDVKIGNEVVNFNTLSKVEDTHEYQLTHEVMTRGVDMSGNYLKGTTKRHKYWAEGRYRAEDRQVQIEFTAHRKNMFGWNKYACKYHIKIVASCRDAQKNGWQYYDGFITGFFDGVDRKLYTPQEGCWTTKYSSHTKVGVGRVRPKTAASIVLIIYSDGTGAEAEGTLRIGYVAQ